MTHLIIEQIVVILTTTLSLLTAWSWNSVLQQYVTEYYGNSLQTRLGVAAFITLLTFLLISWLIKSFDAKEENLNKIKRAHLTDYVAHNSNIA